MKAERTLYKAHPWHGITSGKNPPDVVHAYIEVVPTDVMKYEVDKASGYLRVDRPQKYSNQCPALYGFVPQTYCGTEVGKFCDKQSGRSGTLGDGDPLDICVLSERPILHPDIFLDAIPIGGIRMIDRNEADDKIIAVLRDDGVYGGWKDLPDCPKNLLDRLTHYFLTYKDLPGATKRRVEIAGLYGMAEAHEVIRCSLRDYALEVIGGESTIQG